MSKINLYKLYFKNLYLINITKMGKTALFIGRFQPPHLGHLDAISQIVSQGVDNILIWIGSSNKEWTKENPFNFDQRKEMIKLLTDWKDLPTVSIHSIPDMGDDEAWQNYILKKFQRFDFVASGNPRVREIFEKIWINTINFDIKVPARASNIRHQIFLNRKWCLKEFLSPEIMEYLERIWAHAMFKKIFKAEVVAPSVAVDGICLDSKWRLILIKRKNPPYWFAIPWWFLDYGESPEDAVKREMSEELSVPLDLIRVKKQVGAFGDPDRDPRWHVISIVYCLELLTDEIKAGDDAADILLIDPAELDTIDLAFDHKEILKQVF